MRRDSIAKELVTIALRLLGLLLIPNQHVNRVSRVKSCGKKKSRDEVAFHEIGYLIFSPMQMNSFKLRW
jgi:hypothetical protein